jgi:L-fucose isomerase-like protein
MAKQMTMGVIVGNRGFFPSHLATSGRLEMVAALEAKWIKPIVLTPEETAHGAVETYEDAKKCADLFKKHASEIDGIIITLPNFGEERGLADTLRLANLQVPVDCIPTRQLLRQDVDLQQPEAVWNSLLADSPPYGSS